MGYLVFKNALLIDGTGKEPIPSASVAVENGLIKEVQTGGKGVFPSAEVIDCKGKTVMPGLIDAHIHLGLTSAEMSELARRNPPGLMAAKMIRNLKESLDQGFTTCRDCGGADAGFRIAVEQKYAVGSRLQVCGPVLSQTGGHGDDRLPAESRAYTPAAMGFTGIVCDGVPAVQRATRELLRQGVDFIKIMAGGGCASPADTPNTSQYSLEELKAIVFEAESAGTYVAAHCYSNRSIRLCAEAGVRTIEHGNLMEAETAKIATKAGCCLVPTLATYEAMTTHGKEWGLPQYVLDKVAMVREAGFESLKHAVDAGMIIGAGSDLACERQIYKGSTLELQARVQGAMGAIVSSTKTNAEILRIADRLGTIEPGKIADIIVIDGNPLEDMSLFCKYEEKIPVIMKEGELYKNKL